MKKIPNAEANPPDSDDMLPEYRFDYKKAKPNRFAKSASSNRSLPASEVEPASRET